MGVLTKGNPNYNPYAGIQPVDYSAILPALSDNNKTIELAQIHSQQVGMEQLNLDREMQQAATIELGLESLDTKIHISKLEYIQRMSAEENRHTERLAESNDKLRRLQKTHSTEADLPSPEIDS